MKEFKLKVRKLSEPVETPGKPMEFMSYRTEIISILRYASSPSEPLSFDEIELSISIRSKLRNANDEDTVSFTEEEMGYVKTRVLKSRFLIADQAYLELKKDVTNAI